MHVRALICTLVAVAVSCGPGLPESGPLVAGSLPATSGSAPIESAPGTTEPSIDPNTDWSELIPDGPDEYTRPEGDSYPYGRLEHFRYRVACLRHLGFEVLEASNGIDYSLNRGAHTFQNVLGAEVACEERPVALGLVAPQSPGDSSIYAELLRVYECLKAGGFPFPELVTLDAFLDGEPWDPYELVGGFASAPVGADVPAGLSEAVDASEACPFGGLGG